MRTLRFSATPGEVYASATTTTGPHSGELAMIAPAAAAIAATAAATTAPTTGMCSHQ